MDWNERASKVRALCYDGDIWKAYRTAGDDPVLTDYVQSHDPDHFKALEGQTLVRADQGVVDSNDAIIFRTVEGNDYIMTHRQDCCEDVRIEDIVGDLSDLYGSPILSAQVESNTGPARQDESWSDYTCTWTFYHLRTAKATVTIRWYGESNGYYSEEVDFRRLEDDK